MEMMMLVTLMVMEMMMKGNIKRKIHEMDSRSEKGIWSAGSILRPLINITSMGLNALAPE